MNSFEREIQFQKLNNSSLINQSMNASLNVNGPSSANKRSNVNSSAFKTKESLSK